MNDEIEKASVANDLFDEYKINLDMWKHYDNLRQQKNRAFLTANSILAAAIGLVLKEQLSGSESSVAIALISLGGAIACVLWFFLQSRNALYIDFHRERVKEIEPRMIPNFSTFSKDWDRHIEKVRFCEKWRSNVIDRLLSALVAAFWAGLVIYFCVPLIRCLCRQLQRT